MKKIVNQSRRDVLAFLGSATALSLFPADLCAEQAVEGKDMLDIPYTVAEYPWPALLGNHRVHIFVENSAEAVDAHIPWRRLDPNPEQKAVLVYNAEGVQIQNVVVDKLTREFGRVAFEAKKSGDYFFYYLPHADLKGRHSVLGPKGKYRNREPGQESVWLQRFGQKSSAKMQRQRLPQAQVIEFQSRTALDSFYPMEIPATTKEIQILTDKHQQSILLFPEDREHPIKMYDNLPLRWVQRGPQNSFSAEAFRGEFYVFQIGVYASQKSNASSEVISLHFDDLAGANGEVIPSSAWMCVNTNGVDTHGNTFHKEAKIEVGRTTALWCGVQVPLHAKAGKYSGKVSVVQQGSSTPILFDLEVKRDFIGDGGADQLWRSSRIQWLNSTVGSESTVTSPYVPLQMQGRAISCLGREVIFGDNGFPVSIKVGNRELLHAPVELAVHGSSRTIQWKSTSQVIETNPSKIVLESLSEGEGYTLRVKTTMEFDGGIGCEVRLVSNRATSTSDIALEIPYKSNAVPYAVGMALKGGSRPHSWQWKWSDQPQRWKDQGSNLEYFLWLGDVHAGLYCRLKSPLQDWQNGNKGGVTIAETNDCIMFRASSGSRTIKPNEDLSFSFRLLPTPVKPIDPQHWKFRYAHAYQPPADLHALDATVINIHQGTLPNMYINYPFLNLDLLGPYVSDAHALGMKVKLYYTMRELTTRLPELWAFRSLGDEIYRMGGTQGQGNPQLDFWLQEHLHGDYSPGWITLTPTGDIDTSLRVYSDSRLANFYLEGLKWLLDNVPIDGLYLDEIGYPRDTMQRVRRVLERRPGAMIDMHGNDDWWSCNCPIGYYMEHLPYIDRLWLGEGFDPDSPPDFWLIEMSGIPFGLSSDLLEKPNPWRGMLFGMTDRALYSGLSPTPIWKLWQAFGIEDATMIGWWEEGALIKVNKPDVLATVYRKEEKSLIAIASWSKQMERIQLKINWKGLGIDPQRAKITAPELDGLQETGSFSPNQSITVQPGKGYLLLFEQS